MDAPVGVGTYVVCLKRCGTGCNGRVGRIAGLRMDSGGYGWIRVAGVRTLCMFNGGGGVSVGDGGEWGMEGICGLQGRWGWLERATKGEESGTYFVRRSGWVLLASASSEARAADVFLLRASVA